MGITCYTTRTLHYLSQVTRYTIYLSQVTRYTIYLSQVTRYTFYLSQVSNRGNMCVWPGSHRKIHPLTRSPDGAVRRGNGGYTNADGPLPDLGPPTQVAWLTPTLALTPNP